MSTLDDFRRIYPEYAGVDDRILAAALYEKYGQGKDKFDFWLEVTGKGERATPFETGMAGLKSSLQTLGAAGLERLGFEDAAKEQLAAAEARQEDIAQRYRPEVPTAADIGMSPSRLGTYIMERGAESLPYMIPPVAGAIAGSLVGGPFGAAVGATAAGVPSFAGSNIRRALEEGETLESASLTKAVGVAVPQAALDAIITRYIPGIGRAGTGSLLRRTVTKAVEGGAVESLTETAQQALEVAQANPEKLLDMPPEIQTELMEAAIAGGILGAGFGAATGVAGRREPTAAPAAPAPTPTKPEETPAAPAVPPPATPPTAGPALPGPVTPTVPGPTEPVEPVVPQGNEWLRQNAKEVEKLNESPITVPVTEEVGQKPAAIKAGEARYFFDPSVTDKDTGSPLLFVDPQNLRDELATRKISSTAPIRYVDVSTAIDSSLAKSSTPNAAYITDPNLEKSVLASGQDYTYQPPKIAPLRFSSFVDKALYAVGKNENPDQQRIAKQYLVEGLNMSEDEIALKSQEVVSKIDKEIEDNKAAIAKGKPVTDEPITLSRVSQEPSVITFPVEARETIGGIDVNTTDPEQRAKLDDILAKTPLIITAAEKKRLENYAPGVTDLVRDIQLKFFPGLKVKLGAKTGGKTPTGRLFGSQDPSKLTSVPQKLETEINVYTDAAYSPQSLLHTIFHEFAHVFESTWFSTLPKDQLQAIIQQYVKDVIPLAYQRIAANSIFEGIEDGYLTFNSTPEDMRNYLLNRVEKDKKGNIVLKGAEKKWFENQKNYLLSFKEWIAERGANWYTKSERVPKSILQKALKGLYDGLRKIYIEIANYIGITPDQGAFEQLLSEIYGRKEMTPAKADYYSIMATRGRAVKEAIKAGVNVPLGASYQKGSKVINTDMVPGKTEPGYSATGDRLVSETHPLTEKDVETQGINPALVSPDVPLEMQQIGAFTTARKNQGVWGRLFDFITGRVEGESHAQAMFRNSVASAIPFLSRVEYKEVGRTIERMQNVQGRISGLISIGFMDYNPVTGELKFNNKYGGLIKIFDRIGTKDEDAFQEYAIARRELDLRKAGKSGLGYKVTDAQLKQIIESAPAHFKEVAAEFENYNKGMIQFSLDSGLIPKELADRFMSMFYVPFYRVQDDGTANMGTLHPKITKALEDPKGISAFNQDLGIGGMIERGFYDNILRNYSTIVASGLKNIAYNSVAKAALTADGKAIDTSIAEPVGKPGGDGVITYRVKGGDRYLKINDVPMFQSLAAMSPKQLGAFTEAASKAANVLRTGVTIAPPFQIANLWRGIIDTYVKTGMPITDLIAGTFKNFREVYRKGPSYQAILAATGFGGYGYGAGFRDQAAFMRRAYTTADIAKPWGLVMKALDKLEHIGEATEMASRVTYRDYLVKKGVDPATAAYEAVNLTNFNRSGAGGGVIGNTLMHLIPMIPFLNARVQGLYRLIETDTAGAPRSWLAKGTIGIPIAIVKRGLQLTAIELALNMIYGDEDWYKKLSVEDKVANNYFRFNDTVIAAPRAFEIGSIYGAIPALILDSIREKEGSQFTDGLIHIMSSTFLFNPIPQAVKPIAEVVVNKDMFTWRDIETIADKNRLRKERFDESTTEVAKALAEVTPFSPKQADILVRGYLGTMGTVFASVVDGFVSEAGVRPQGYFGDPVSKLGIAANATGLSRFVKDPELLRNRFIKDFYDMKLSVTQITRSIDDAGVAGNLESLKEKLKNDPAAQSVAKVLNRAESRINDINKQMTSIRMNPNLSAEEKTKRLTALRNLKNQTAEQAFALGRKYGYD